MYFPNEIELLRTGAEARPWAEAEGRLCQDNPLKEKAPKRRGLLVTVMEHRHQLGEKVRELMHVGRG